ncbi:bifunctional tRNA (5-methylaminomethyl-2-thiouridine)(34)-methyltransferase MnmD/FAD-dependent 5-carboxymethylaminomethyl-2-thiouridine(34) oxidoreductase MnmC, partial [Pseudomonas brassicacearum]|uniref:bifunctional tRNA (5-methylaminomethyl-2-thiouridine)(34)-methyltransferase MnmD/FAD-dependent 5-carboxymethylaminomethyl-2-thiouridine(34) oxidoreductase MnmC n=1 Tax=Pseudomonas brassicacearum TaxID=930166 RepID=UPI001E5F8E07
FGTGLNFLCANCSNSAHRQAPAAFRQCREVPLDPQDLGRALALWPQLSLQAEQLLEQYVAIHQGFQRLVLADGRVTLTLLIGDALEQLPQLDGQIDAWFLDGFAPARNPEMWTAELFAELARLAAPDATLSTFTSTGWVRRLLNAAGFKMKRTPGIGHKWEILRGVFLGWPEQTPAPAPAKPWYARPATLTGERRALVIGGGLAGCASAASLAARGWQVTLLERHAGLAEEASGNPQGVLYLKLSAHGTALSQMILSGFGYTRRVLEQLQRGTDWDACGVLQLAFNSKEAERQAQLAEAFPRDLLHTLDQSEAQVRSGIGLACGGLFLSRGRLGASTGVVSLASLGPAIDVQPHHEVLQLRRVDGHWQAWDGERCLASAPVAILASAAEIKRFEAAADLPLKRIRGKSPGCHKPPAARAWRPWFVPKVMRPPPRLGEHTLGASFDFNSDDLTPTAAEHAGNLQMLEEISLDLVDRLNAGSLDPERLEGRAAFRCTSPDYLPIVGPLADRQAFTEAYAPSAKTPAKYRTPPARGSMACTSTAATVPAA